MPVDDPGQDVGEIGERIDVVELASLDQGCDDGPMSTPPSDPANSAFLRLSLMPRIDRSAVLLSSSMRPSSMKRVNLASEGIADGLGELDLLADESQLSAQPYLKASAGGRLFCCRTRRRSSALRPRISFSIA